MKLNDPFTIEIDDLKAPLKDAERKIEKKAQFEKSLDALDIGTHMDNYFSEMQQTEPNDPKFYGIINGAGESLLLHHIKKQLNRQGGDYIKKRMWKDGNLVDEMQQYVRSRKLISGAICIYNGNWAFNCAAEQFNKGEVNLAVHTLVD